jgi:hypothetical protein
MNNGLYKTYLVGPRAKQPWHRFFTLNVRNAAPREACAMRAARAPINTPNHCQGAWFPSKPQRGELHVSLADGLYLNKFTLHRLNTLIQPIKTRVLGVQSDHHGKAGPLLRRTSPLRPTNASKIPFSISICPARVNAEWAMSRVAVIGSV